MLVGHRSAGGVAALALAAAGVVGPVVGPAAAATGPECGSGTSGAITDANTPYDQLGIAAAAAKVSPRALRGVDVVVLAPRTQESLTSTAAGIVGGPPLDSGTPVGFAGGVHVSAEPYGGDQEATSHDLAVALRGLRKAGRHTIVLVQGVVKPSSEVHAAIGALRSALVVAPIGERPQGADDPVLGALFSESADAPPRDAAGRTAPASDPSVLAVGVAGWSYADGGPLLDSDVDVAAPVGGGIAYAPGPCVVPGVLTNWAAAEVAGVAALTWAAYPSLSSTELRSRLELTADGGGARQGGAAGYGVVQPLAAVTISRQALAGKGPTAPLQHRAQPPERPADVLAGTRRSALWWGLLGGGGLVVALLLRPLLSRRSPRR